MPWALPDAPCDWGEGNHGGEQTLGGTDRIEAPKTGGGGEVEPFIPPLPSRPPRLPPLPRVFPHLPRETWTSFGPPNADGKKEV